MRKTENFKLNLLDAEDFVNREDLNDNAEKIDATLKEHDTPEYDVSEQTKVEGLTSGESIKVALRKLAKAVADYISHKADEVAHITAEERTAWTAKLGAEKIAANLTTTTAGMVLDATMGKQLQDNKVDKVSGKGLSTNDYTTAEKNKLAGIAAGANKTTVDSALSSSSTNPVQNNIITEQTNKLFYLVAKALEGSSLWKSVSSCYISGDLGAVYYGYMDVNDCKNNIGKEVIVCYSNGAIGKSKITNASGYYSLEPTITWLHSSVPYVNKTTIQGGTKTLPISGTSSYGYVLPTTYGAVLEISNANNFATKYLILN